MVAIGNDRIFAFVGFDLYPIMDSKRGLVQRISQNNQ